MKHISYILIIFSGLMATVAVAQPADTAIVSDEVQVLSSFNAKLQSSNKLRTTPNILTDNSSSSEALNYKLPTRLLSLDYEPPVIKPLAMPREPVPKVYNFYGKVGYGTPSSPIVDLRYNGNAIDNLDYGINLRHHSANNNGSIASQRFSKTAVDVDGNYYYGGFGFGANVGYALDDYYFYGDLDAGSDSATTSIPSDSLRQRFNTITFGAEFFNAERTVADINYNAKLDIYNMSGSYNGFDGRSEPGSDFGIRLAATFSKVFNETNPLTFTVVNDYNRYSEDTASANNNVFSVIPNFTYHGEAFQVKIGFNTGLDSSFYFMPDVEASYNLAGDKFVIIAGWTSEVLKNSYRNTVAINPFVFTPLELRNTRLQKQYAGVKILLDGIDIEGTIGNKPVNNLQMYLNEADTLSGRYFHTRYADGNIFNIHAEAIVNAIPHLQITGSLDFNTYNLEGEARAWHLPNLEANFSAIYKMLEDKLALRGEMYFANSIAYQDEVGEEQVLNGVFDLSLGMAYQFTENIGAFLDLNNVTGQRYVRWYRYPNFGFNMKVGVTARF